MKDKPYLLYRDNADDHPDFSSRRRFFAYGFGIGGVTEPSKASWLSLSEVKTVQYNWEYVVTWTLLPEDETLVYIVMGL